MKNLKNISLVVLSATLFLASCFGGEILLEGDSQFCLTNAQCSDGQICQSDGTCNAAQADVTVDIAPDLPEDTTEVQECVVSDEICDGLDNDCDDEIDEDLEPLTCGVGECMVTIEACVDGIPQECIPGQSSDEICDGLDNDCDGEADEELGSTTCGDGECEVTVENCANGEPQECIPGDPAGDEVCDGLDNNCNGDVDENLGTTSCGDGACEVTVDNCVNGIPQDCVPGEPGADEECDGLDNNCNGEVDEELGATTCGIGECEVTVDNCVDGVTQECIPDEPTDEVCDGFDNDCDDEIDEELGTTTCGIGECELTVDNCVDGLAQDCVPAQGVNEVCDGLDNDCDEDIDEELGSTTCGLGICKTTVENCINGQPQDCIAGDQTDEICDGLDNDCDGEVDEGLLCSGLQGLTFDTATGQSLPGTLVIVKAAGDCSPGGGGGPEIDSTVTGEAALYTFVLPQGDYCLEAQRDAYQDLITESVSLGAGEVLSIHLGLTPEDSPTGFAAVCGRVRNADTLALIQGATVKLGANILGNVVASTLTTSRGFYCITGISLATAQSWHMRADATGYLAATKSPVLLEPNVVRMVHFLLHKDSATECHFDDFEIDDGWTPTDPMGGVYWHHRGNEDLINQAYPDCVSIAPAEDCLPDPLNPLDQCPLCQGADATGCVPAPGALPRAYSGIQSAWFGNPDTGNFLGDGGFCAGKNGGSGEQLWGTYTSEAIYIPSEATNLRVLFKYWYEIEGVDPDGQFDQMVVLASTNGLVYEEVGTVNPTLDTDGLDDEAFTSSGLLKVPAWTGADFALDQSLAVQVAAGETLYLRLSFDTGDGNYNGFRGWFVDDLAVVGDGCPQPDSLIQGLAYDAANGAPVPGALVSVKAAGDCSLDNDDGATIVSIPTNADGFYDLALPAGDYCLEALGAGYDKMITENFTLEVAETAVINLGLDAVSTPPQYVTACGRVTDANDGFAMPGASVTLSADDLSNVVASAVTDQHGRYCIGGIPAGAVFSWHLQASADGYVTKTESDVALLPNVVSIVHFALTKDLVTTCFYDGFEIDVGWQDTGAAVGPRWQHRDNSVLINIAYPDCVSLSTAEECVPDLLDPNDPCPLCKDASITGCIPEPGALPRAYDGSFAIWYGDPETGNYLGQGPEVTCAGGSGGTGTATAGTYTSPQINIGPAAANLRVAFRYWFEIEGVDPDDIYDQMTIEVSTDGQVFQTLGTVNPAIDTDSTPDVAYSSAGYLKVPAWAATDMALEQQLSEAIVDQGSMFVRFKFDSGDGSYNGFRGWLVDELKVLGDGCQ